MKDSFVFLAQGFEEIEAITVVDVLRRANIQVKTVSITNSLQVEGAHGVIVTANTLFSDIDFKDLDWIILPGGMPGASNLAAFAPLNELIVAHFQNNGNIAAICAAPPVILAPLNIMNGKEATCYPGFEDKMYKTKKGIDPVITSKNLITAVGPSAAMQFALALVSAINGEKEAHIIAANMLLYPEQHEYYF
ncbi:MAG: DJ-1/PfpI family protein [Muribaculaceae bacterium]